MAQNLQLTAVNGLDLADDIALLEAIGAVVDKWSSLQAQLGGGLGTVEATLAAIATGDADGTVRTAFGTVGLASQYTTLKTDIGKLISNKTIDPRFEALLSRLSALTSGGNPNPDVKWSISTSGSPPKLPAGYNLDLGGSAALEFDAAASSNDVPAANPLLSLGASGDVKVGGSDKLPIPYGSLTIGGNASAELDLTYFFDAPRSELFALAIASRARDLADPFDLTSVWSHFAGSDLAGLTCGFNGAASVQAQISLGDTVALAAGRVPIDIGATVTATANVSTLYQLSLRKQTDAAGAISGIEVNLKRNPVLSGEVSGQVGVTVDLSQLATPITKILSRIAADWNSALDTIKPFLTPGTWLRSQLINSLDQQVQALVADPNLRNAIVSDLSGALGATQATDSAIANWVSGQIAGAIDRASVLVDADLVRAKNSVLAYLAVSLPSLSQVAQTQLSSLVASAVSQLDQGLQAAANGLLATPEADLAKALADAGARVNGAVNTLDNVLKPVRDLLSKVDAEFQKVLTQAEQALQQKVTARIYFDDTPAEGQIVVLDGVFSDDDDASQTLYRALTTGNLQVLVSEIDGQLTAPGFSLKSGSITTYSSSKSEEGIEIAFLDVDATLQDIVSSQAQTLVDAAGNVHVELQGTINDTFAALGAKRAVAFVETAALVQAAAMKAKGTVGPPVIDLGISALYQSESFGWSDVADFIGGLASANLISQTAPKVARTVFTGWAGGGNGRINGGISGNLRLSGIQIAGLLSLAGRSPAPSNVLSDAAKIAIIDTSLKHLLSIDPYRRAQFLRGKRAVSSLGDQVQTGSDAAFVFTCQGYLPDDGSPFLPGHTMGFATDSSTLDDCNNFMQDVYALWQIVDMIETMGEIYLSVASPAPGKPGWSVKQYADAQSALVENAKEWINLDLPLTEIMSANVSPWTVAFLRIAADLAGLAAQPGGVMLTMSWTPASGEPKTAVFG